ncbi:MAG: hypothetical protein JOZ38_00300, partial [Candidatus Eremiobacteraeota bacterium]|nr:hypothetical protein [Candidatus Eremiobacteraeota bacterium]
MDEAFLRYLRDGIAIFYVLFGLFFVWKRPDFGLAAPGYFKNLKTDAATKERVEAALLRRTRLQLKRPAYPVIIGVAHIALGALLLAGLIP